MNINYKLPKQRNGIIRSFTLFVAIILVISCVDVVIPVYASPVELLNPITGTVQGAGYDESAGHYGIDLYPYSYGDPIYAVASGTIMYSCPRNHTSAVQAGDDCCTVKIILDEPITHNGITYVCAFYTHMSSLVYDIYCGYKPACVSEYNAGLREGALLTESVHVEARDVIGYAGKGNGATHLHLSFEASEADGYAMMPNSEYYEVFGWSYGESITAGCGTSISTPISVTQSFNPVWPCDAYYVTCLYYYKDGSKHSSTYWDKAIDIAQTGDVNVYAIEAGTVTYSGWSTGGLGYKVMIEHDNGHTSIYGHLKTIPSVSKGAKVTRGQVIGKMGGTGGYGASAGTISFGQHLHFEYSGADLWDTVWKDSLKSALTYEANCYSNNYRNGTYNGNNSKSVNIVSWLSSNYTKNSSGIYTYNGSHSHSYSIIEYEVAHPHKAYKKCSCGAYEYTGATTYVASCSSCNTCSCSTSYAGTYICATESLPLNIRDGHSTSSAVIGQIPSGASVTVTAGNGTWAHVTHGGVSGYASMEYLKIPYTLSGAYPVPFKCYPLSDAEHAADAYDAPGGNHIGYIYGTDYCTVKEVYSNGYCLVNCPWGSSTKDVYAYTGAFLNTSCSPTTKVAEKEATTYIRLGSSSTLGWIDARDTIVIVDNTYSTRTQVIYPHTDGTYRCAWVDASALVHKHTYGPAATCTKAQYCTTCDTLLVDKLEHSAGSIATCTSNQICTVCGLVLNTKIAHTPGTAATCITPQLCTVCNATLVAATGHTYTAGTYTEPTHSHKVYNVCICGEKQDSGTTTKVNGCNECYPAPIISGITYEPQDIVVNETTMFTLNATGASEYQIVIGDGVDVLYRSDKMSTNSFTYTFNSTGDYCVWGYAYNGESSTISETIHVSVVESLTQATISLGNIKGTIGNTVTVPIVVENNPGIVSITLEVAYDTNVFTLTGVHDTSLLSGSMHSDIYASPYTLTWENDVSESNFYINGTIVELVFTIAENAVPGDYVFTVSSPKDGIYDVDINDVTFVMDAGTCTVIDYILGDVNSDGEVTNKDRVLLSRYLAKWSGYDINMLNFAATDINGDGEITNKDRVILSRHLAKWSGYENLSAK